MTHAYYKRENIADHQLSRNITVISYIQDIFQYYFLRGIQYTDYSVWEHQCGYRCNNSNTDQIFCILKIFEAGMDFSGTVHLLSVDLKKVRRNNEQGIS
jgi:hypothetical protein